MMLKSAQRNLLHLDLCSNGIFGFYASPTGKGFSWRTLVTKCFIFSQGLNAASAQNFRSYYANATMILSLDQKFDRSPHILKNLLCLRVPFVYFKLTFDLFETSRHLQVYK